VKENRKQKREVERFDTPLKPDGGAKRFKGQRCGVLSASV
jgi:hypothetical protein